MPRDYEILEEAIELGEKEGLFRIKENKIEYIQQRKSYKISDPEEHVRASFYIELIKKYQYPKERIDLEVSVKDLVENSCLCKRRRLAIQSPKLVNFCAKGAWHLLI